MRKTAGAAADAGAGGGAVASAGDFMKDILATYDVITYKVGEGQGRGDKTLTALLVDADTGTMRAFGDKARTEFARLTDEGSDVRVQHYSNFKMALADTSSGGSMLDVMVSASGSLPVVPRGVALPDTRRTVLQLIAMSLRAVKDDALGELRKPPGTVPPAAGRIFWAVTVPAIWSDEAKHVMRRAALDAGLTATLDARNLALMLEPECAMLATLLGLAPAARERIGPGARVVVVDCGGGTVDITYVKVKTLTPFKVEELAAASGGPWGSTYVDREFLALMREVVGEVWTKAERGTFLSLLQRWQAHKHLVGAGTMAEDAAALPMGEVLDSLAEFAGYTVDNFQAGITAYNTAHRLAGDSAVEYRDRSRTLVLPAAVVRGFFARTVGEMVSHLTAKLAETPCEYMLVAGGYAESKLLQTALTSNFAARCTVVVPPRPGSVVSTGAAMLALQPVVDWRVMRFSYAFETAEPFKPALHSLALKYTADGVDYADILSPFAQVDSKVVSGKEVTISLAPISSAATHVVIHFYRTRGRIVDPVEAPTTPRSVVIPASGDVSMNHGVPVSAKVGSVTVLLGGVGRPRHERTVTLTFIFGDTELKARAVATISGEAAETAILYEPRR